MCRAFRPNRFLVEWQLYRLIAIAARDLDRAIAARVNVAEMKGTCFIFFAHFEPQDARPIRECGMQLSKSPLGNELFGFA